MKRFVMGLGCLAGLVLAPSIASAALTLDIGPKHGATPSMDTSDAVALPGNQSFDLVFTEVAPTENEGLFAYDLLLTVPTAARDKIAITGADAGGPGFVLGDDPNKYTFTVAEQDANHVLVNVSSNNDLFDITSGKKAARVFYTVDPNIDLGDYSIVFDTANTVFGSGDPNRPDPAIPVGLVDAGFVQVVPEPASLSLLGFAGLLVLRRRRAA